MTTSDTLTAPVRPGIDDGDHERFAHYVRAADAVRAAVDGTPCTALCGKRWVPVRDPSRFPVCPECKELYEAMRAREGKA